MPSHTMAVVVVAVLAASLFLGAAVKGGMETLGLKLTKVAVNVKSVSLSPLSGSGSIKVWCSATPKASRRPRPSASGPPTSLSSQPH